jgi:hypothetical protein
VTPLHWVLHPHLWEMQARAVARCLHHGHDAHLVRGIVQCFGHLHRSR